jgi:hypothetical protein
VFGTLLANQGTFTHGMRVSLLAAAAVVPAVGAAAALNAPRRVAACDGRVRSEVMGRGTTAATGPETQKA